MHLKVTAIAAALLLAGCASPGGLREGAPRFEQMTDSPAQKVAGCVGDRIEATAIARQGRVSSRPTATGYSITLDQTVSGYGGVDTVALVDISMVDGKTRVQLWTNFLMGDGGIPAAVRSCL